MSDSKYLVFGGFNSYANSLHDNSFVHGGWSDRIAGSESKDSSDVYILTLPGFRWFRVAASAPSRAGSSCQVVGNRQLLSIGGWDPTAIAPYASKDPWNYGIGIFDMTELSWRPRYNADSAPYVRSDVVNEYYTNRCVF